ncbi:MAG: response regulator transcription factor [Oligoflexales bacterium]|nr:response regulator transcription factor [Oligoflexales bacterium]
MEDQQQKILLVEDEKNLAFNLELNLKAEGFEVYTAGDGELALEHYHNQGPFSAIILDVMIPEIDGFEVAKTIRKKDNTTGILMLTARAGDEDRVKGLSIGADDYLTKPFLLEELVLRVKRMAERAKMYRELPNSQTRPTLINAGPFELDKANLTLKSPQGTFELTVLEADVLEEFLSNPEQTLSRKHLLNKVWGLPGNIETRTVDNFILRIRRFLEADPANPKYLCSIRGKGYRLNLEDKPDESTQE